MYAQREAVADLASTSDAELRVSSVLKKLLIKILKYVCSLPAQQPGQITSIRHHHLLNLVHII